MVGSETSLNVLPTLSSMSGLLAHLLLTQLILLRPPDPSFRIRDILLPPNLHGFRVDHVTNLVRTMVRKIQALVFVWGNMPYTQVPLLMAHNDLKFLRLENASLTKWKDDYTSVSLGVILQSFENALLQVEHFHHPLTISRDQVQPD